jgi:DNA-binding GntR family transcriptional regulator
MMNTDMANSARGGSLRYETAASIAEQAIRAAILDGVFAPGDELRELTLADELGLSRTPIREALLALQGAGLVEMTRGRIARVRERTPQELIDTYELRAEVEAYTARRAALFITNGEIQQLWASCDRFAEHIDDPEIPALVQENLLFHDTVHRAARNRRAPEIIRALVEMPLLYASYAWYTAEQRRQTEQDHRAITRALEARDGETAGRRMYAHVVAAGQAAWDASH